MSIQVPSYIDLIKEVRKELDLGIRESKGYVDQWIGGVTVWQNTPIKNIEGTLYSFRTWLANHKEMLLNAPIEFDNFELYVMAVHFVRNNSEATLSIKANKFIDQYERDVK